MDATPDYACAVIEHASCVLLQVRPATAPIAPDMLTCFGGRREANEDPLACLRRELAEELDWSPPTATPACDLWQGERWIARFWRCAWDHSPLRTEPGHLAIWAPWPTLPGLPISPWHRSVLIAVATGVDLVRVAE